MLPKTIEDLNRIRDLCYSDATTRASISAAVAAIPLPGPDVAADVGLLMTFIPEVQRRFGLSHEQMGMYDSKLKQMIAGIAIEMGTRLVGQVVTKQTIMFLLKSVGIRMTVKQVAKYIPFIGSVLSATISFGAMKYICNQTVEECHGVALRMLEESMAREEVKSSEGVSVPG